MSELTQRFFETLLHTQFQSPERTLHYQRRLLERLLRHARATVPYYRDSGRLDVLFTKDDRIDWERWDEIPVLTRSQAQAYSKELYAESTPPECGEATTGTTSGSTGTPLAFRTSTIQGFANTAVQERGYVWAGMPERLTVGWILGASARQSRDSMGTRSEFTIRGATREIYQFYVGTTAEQQRDWLARIRPDVVMGYPGNLAVLARDPPPGRFRLVVCLGEVVTPQRRTIIETGFGCRVMELYSGSEYGLVAVEDPSVRRLLVSEETMLLELNRPADPSLLDGRLSEVVVTPFYNYAMPLIRYAPGDLAEADPTRPLTSGRCGALFASPDASGTSLFYPAAGAGGRSSATPSI